VDIPTPPPPHVRLADAEKSIEDALKNPATRKRLRQAGQKIVADIAEMLRNTPPNGTPRTT